MKTRFELNDLAADIRLAAQRWNGGEKIKVGQIDTTVAQVAQNVLDKLNQYLTEEKSLIGRIETSQNLLNALDGLQNKSLDPNKEQDLISTLRSINQIIFSATQLQEDLKSQVCKPIQDKINLDINDRYVNLTLPNAKILKNAFRTIRNVYLLDESFCLEKNFQGSRQVMSHITLKQDLERFLASYHHSMTDHQRSLIGDVLSLLAKGAEIDMKITLLIALLEENGAPDEVIESGIADIAYEIEKSIDALKIGETFIFPGSYVHRGSGHSILYEVQRVRDEDYHFAVFNPGLQGIFGQDFLQQFKIENGLSRQSRVPLFTQLKKEALVDQSFLSDLIRFQVKDAPYKMNSVIQALLMQLKRKFSAEQTTRELHDRQTWGTCSYDSVENFLEYKLPPSLFIPFQYDMMLRARNELTHLLSQGGGMDQEVLRFLDQKSCETIADWKRKFDQYCYPFEKGDLTLAKILNVQNMKNQDDVKKILETWSDHDILDAKKLGFFHRISYEMVERVCENGDPILDPFSPSAIAECTLFVGLPWGILFLLGLLEGGEETDAFHARRQVLKRVQGLIKQVSPEAAKMLYDRNQELGSENQPFLGKEINLSGVFNYLKTRYEEFSMCVVPLLNSTFSPLKEAAIACPNLPAAPTSDWQIRKLAAF